jgi:hypothetical protein
MHEEQVSAFTCARVVIAAILGLWAAFAPASEPDDAFIPRIINSSTIPPNGDLNPYGVAFVPERFPAGGAIAAGDVLISNFNSSANVQGTGTTIVQLTPRGSLAPPGTAAVFFTSSLPGLSTALGVLRDGFVIIGNVPTTDGSFDTIGQGALQVIDRLPTAMRSTRTYCTRARLSNSRPGASLSANTTSIRVRAALSGSTRCGMGRTKGRPSTTPSSMT